MFDEASKDSKARLEYIKFLHRRDGLIKMRGDGVSTLQISFFDPKRISEPGSGFDIFKRGEVLSIDPANNIIMVRYIDGSVESLSTTSEHFKITEVIENGRKVELTIIDENLPEPENFTRPEIRDNHDFLVQMQKILKVDDHNWEYLSVDFKTHIIDETFSSETFFARIVKNKGNKVLLVLPDGTAKWFSKSEISVIGIERSQLLPRYDLQTLTKSKKQFDFRVRLEKNNLQFGDKITIGNKSVEVVAQHGDIVVVQEGNEMFYLSQEQLNEAEFIQ